LIELGSDVQMATSRGTNILSMTATGGNENTEVYDLILSKNVDIHSSNSSGANALLLLAGSNADDANTFEYLVEKGLSWNSKDNDGNGLFNYAARGGNMEIMKMCVGKDLDYTSINSKGENALFFASYGRKRSEIQLETFKYLESLGLEADVVNWEGQTPLHNAIFRANEETINFFIEKGVNPNQVDKYGNTVLINAARGKVENIETLLPHIADINHQNYEGHTALSMAVKRGSDKVFDFLVEKGADIHVLDAQENDLMSIAFQSFYTRKEAAFDHIINTLMEHELQLAESYADGNTLAHLAIEENSAYLLKKAIALGTNVNLKNDIGLSPLHLAAMKATDKNMIELLLEAGADKSVRTEFEESAYELANENELLDGDAVTTELLKMDD
ncbi:MAG: ankyrin repeat domain-containing protein, partial [Bacteroidota bacterium]